MKNLFLAFTIVVSSSTFANELSWVDEQVAAIKPPRVGMSSRTIAKLKDPFIFLEKNRSEEYKNRQKEAVVPTYTKQTTNTKVVAPRKVRHVKKVLTLGLIMNNSVMINNQWYKLGDIINGYKITEINLRSVLLVKDDKKLLLSTKSSSPKLKFQK